MGMYFTVRRDASDACPYCEEPIKEWQSKSNYEHDVWGDCCDRHPSSLGMLEKEEVENFYTICTNKDCEKWIEYKVNEPYTLVEEANNPTNT